MLVAQPVVHRGAVKVLPEVFAKEAGVGKAQLVAYLFKRKACVLKIPDDVAQGVLLNPL